MSDFELLEEARKSRCTNPEEWRIKRQKIGFFLPQDNNPSVTLHYLLDKELPTILSGKCRDLVLAYADPVIRLALDHNHAENVVICTSRALLSTSIFFNEPPGIDTLEEWRHESMMKPRVNPIAVLPLTEDQVFAGVTTNRFGQFFAVVASLQGPQPRFCEHVRVYRYEAGKGSLVNQWQLPLHFHCDDVHAATSAHVYFLGRFFYWTNGRLTQNSCVLVYNCDGNGIRQFRENKISETKPGYIAKPLRITTFKDKRCNVLVADMLPNRTVRLQMFDFNGKYISTVAVFPPYAVKNQILPKIQQVTALEVNVDHEIYILDGESKLVHVISSTGVWLHSFTSDTWKKPAHLAISPTHHQVMVADSNSLQMWRRYDRNLMPPASECDDVIM